MLNAACPACGRPRPVSLASPDHITCWCGYAGPPRPEVQEALAQAAAGVIDLGRRRRLSGYRARDAKLVAFSAKLRLATIVLFFAILGLAAALVGPPILEGRLDIPVGAFSICTCSGPVVLFFPVLFATLGWARRKRKARQRAIPPEAAGASPRCRVCGAPIGLAATQVVAQCEFCGASNVVTADVMTPRELHASSIESYTAGVAAEAATVQRSSRDMAAPILAGLVGATLVGPPLGCVVGSLLSLILG